MTFFSFSRSFAINQPLETDNLVLLLDDNVNGKLLEPTEKEVKELAETLYHEHPEKSKLHWFIAEKLLLLEEIEKVLRENHIEKQVA